MSGHRTVFRIHPDHGVRSFCARVILLLCATGAAPLAAQERVAFRHLTIADGLSQNAVSAIVQDRRGFMWFGTKDGLNRYDGYEFVVFRHDPFDSTSISDSEITALFEDSRGRLWVGTRGGGLNRFDRTHERFDRVKGGPARDITALAEDSSGAIWVGSAGEGLFRLTTNARGEIAADRFAHSPTDVGSVSNDRVRAVLVDRRGILWVGTDAGLDRRGPSSSGGVTFTHFTIRSSAPFALADTSVTALHEDAHGRLWIGSLPGVSAFDSARASIRHYYHKYRTYRYGWGMAVSLVEDRSGAIWVSTRSELMRLDPSTGTFTYFRHDPQNPESINSDLPTQVYRDRSDVIWVATNGYGLNVHDPKANRFQTFRRPEAWPSRLSGFSVYTIFEDRAKNLWIDAGLLYRWNRATGELRSFETSSNRPNDFGNTGVWQMLEDPAGSLWAATYQGLYHYEIATGRSRQYRYDPADSAGLPEQVVYDVFRDRGGVIWAVTENYLVRLTDPARGRFERWQYKERHTSGQWVFPSTIQDAQGALWLGSDQGLVRFDPRTATFQHYRHDPREPASLSHDAVRAILPDPRRPDRVLWIATAGGGLNRLAVDSGTFTHYTERDGLPNNVVYAILPDSIGTLWLSTNKGLSRFDPTTRRFRNYDANDGLQSNEFNSGAAFRSRSGELFFGGIYGFNYFRPEDIHDNPNAPQVVVTGFRRGNHYETVRDTGSVLSTTISEADSLRLSYRDAVLTFEFAALEYSAPAKNRYAYRLVGFNDSWFESGSVRAATYTNLPPGQYWFQVKASNNDGVWNERGVSLAIVIRPPWWDTWWAYTVYAALALAALYGARRYEMNRLRLENRLEIQHLEAEQLRELDRARSRLFANVSHEFRTPLTLTMGPLDDLRAGLHGHLSPAIAEQVDLARRNAGRVLGLINEILDLARAESGRETLHARRVDLGAFVTSVARTFVPLAERKAIAYDVHCTPEVGIVYADPDHLDRALTNLLSNAFKFTPDGGAVRVTVVADDSSARIVVRDSGPGIPASDLHLIFDRFHRAKTAGTQPGTGIGLALAKELVALHGGSIAVESEEGFGSTFTLTLRKGSAHLAPEQIVDDGVAVMQTPRTGEQVALASVPLNAPVVPNGDAALGVVADDVTTVLVVDDNAEVRAYVRQHLAPRYRVLEAVSGEEGLELARRFLPDLVLSDVMMPGMDGYALCRALRADRDTDFIPVILLTARAEAEDRLTGLAEHADDYLTKPFDVRELLARIGNIIAMRRRLRERFAGVGLTIHPAPAGASAADRVFLDQIRVVIEANIGDENFSVERLAGEVAQSRGNLHRKLRDLIGESPSDLIRRMRLERAAELLEAGAGSVGEIAYAVGFKSVAHFSNAFHEQTGVRPSAWREHAIAKGAAQREPVHRGAAVRPS
jgi:signal transduction histidine kinase/ligand-binding sensor domain-containing protein/CheY-like chemotaxis protein/AraC-like DNA-binding protein